MSETATASEPEVADARPARIRHFDPLKPPTGEPQAFYDNIKRKFAEERDLRLGFSSRRRSQYVTNLRDIRSTRRASTTRIPPRGPDTQLDSRSKRDFRALEHAVMA